MKLIDAHIHLDYYKDQETKQVIELDEVEALISVSSNMDSCKKNRNLSKIYSKVKPAFGFHPEQPLPTEMELQHLFQWMETHQAEMIAIGEVGLPYYLRNEQKITSKQFDKYLEVLEMFVKLAKKWEKPIVLHAVYEDAQEVCKLLEKYSIRNAHFHWYKGDLETTQRMIANGYYISITPDVLYKKKIQQLAQLYPIEKMMVETDGPWPFEGPFSGKMTSPLMMKESIAVIARLKEMSNIEVANQLYKNTKQFYNI